MAYVVINNKAKSHLNILYNVEDNSRVFTASSVLYKCLSSNIDLVENITERMKKMQSNEVITSIQEQGRKENKKLRKIAFKVFDTLGWDQDCFDIGYDFICESFYERIPEDIKYEYTDTIEEAFFTTLNRKDFYKFVRNMTEGNLKAKHHMSELLTDMLAGLRIHEQITAYMTKSS
jgi:hypothetical protein